MMMMMLMMMLMMIMIKSQLEFTPLTELDYGTFLCWAANSIGRSLSFSLSLSSLSSWPTSVSSTSSSPCKGLEILGRVKLGPKQVFVPIFSSSFLVLPCTFLSFHYHHHLEKGEANLSSISDWIWRQYFVTSQCSKGQGSSLYSTFAELHYWQVS